MQHNPKQETRTMHRHETDTETTTPREGTKGSDIYRAGNQGGDGVQVNVIMCLILVTGVHPNEQPGEGAHVTGRD